MFSTIEGGGGGNIHLKCPRTATLYFTANSSLAQKLTIRVISVASEFLDKKLQLTLNCIVLVDGRWVLGRSRGLHFDQLVSRQRTAPWLAIPATQS